MSPVPQLAAALSGRLAPPLTVAALTLATFLGSLRNGFVNFDDITAFVENPHIRTLSLETVSWAFGTVFMATYQPLAWLLYAADYALWGPHAPGFHATALALHTLNALLLYAVLLELLRCTGARDDTRARWAAAAGALFWALHPLRVEPVAWISARGQLQANAFTLLTLGLYLHAWRDAPRRRRWRALSVVSFAICMLTKNHALMLPGVLLILDHFVLRRTGSEPWPRLLLEKLPYLAIAALAGLFAVLAKSLSGATALTGEIPHGPVERLLQAGYGLVFYPWKTLLPLGLSPLVPLERQIVLREPVFWRTGVLCLAIAGLCLATLRRAPALFATALAFAVLVAPVLGLTQGGPQLVADRYSYDPALPFSALLAWGLHRLGRSVPARRRLALAMALVLLLLAGLSVRQLRIWSDGVTLWRHALALAPESPLLHLFLANTLREEGQPEAAVAEYTQALERGVHRRADAWNGRAAAQLALGRREEALSDIAQAIREEPRAAFYLNRGLMLASDDIDAAIADWNEALRRDPGLAEAYANRGKARERQGYPAGARADYEQALRHGLGGAEALEIRGRLAALRRSS